MARSPKPTPSRDRRFRAGGCGWRRRCRSASRTWPRRCRFKLTFGRWTQDDTELAAAAHAARARFVDAVAAAQAAGVIPAGDPERVAALLLALGHGGADLVLGGRLSRSGKGHADPEDLVDDLFALLVSAASVDGAQGRAQP